MRFLVDECTGKKLCLLLEEKGHNMFFVGDIMPSAPDKEVIKKAADENRVLITDDKNFGEVVFKLGRPTKGVILLRIDPVPKKRIEAITHLLKNYRVRDRFIVLKEGAVRSRKVTRKE